MSSHLFHLGHLPCSKAKNEIGVILFWSRLFLQFIQILGIKCLLFLPIPHLRPLKGRAVLCILS